MHTELVDREKSVLTDISSGIMRRLNGHTRYESKKVAEQRRKEVPDVSKQVQLFWKQCIDTFGDEVIAAFYGRNFKLQKITAVKERKKVPLVQIAGNPDTGYVFWEEPMYSFIAGFAQVMIAADIGLDQKKELVSLFTELRKKIERYEEHNRRKGELKGSIVGTVDFTRLPYLLNLQEKSICELLPYLLTSYTFNSWHNRFFTGRTRLVPIICDALYQESELLDPSETAKMRSKVPSLAKIFSLKNCKENLMMLPNIRDDERPAPLGTLFDELQVTEVRSPYIRYKRVLDQVFEVWCQVIVKCAPSAEIEGFPSNIDFKSCRELYFGYTNSD